MRDFFKHLKTSLNDDMFSTRVVKPESDIENDIQIDLSKVDAVINDPKFGMLTLFYYHLNHPEQSEEYTIAYCTHVFSLLAALPLLVFISQWIMWFALVIDQLNKYHSGRCPMSGSIEGKMIMFGVSALYFVRSFFLWDNLITRMRLKYSIPAASVTVIIDTFHEFGFDVLVYSANLMLVFIQPSVPEMIMNSLAMEFLMHLDNEFKRMYFEFLPNVAQDIYNRYFKSHETHKEYIENAYNASYIFKLVRYITYIPFKLLMFTLMVFPILCFAFMIYSPICK